MQWNPWQTSWLTTLTRASQRAKRQQALNLQRRAAAIQAGKQALGTDSAVAEQLGVSHQAVADTRKSAAKATVGEPLPESIDLDLSHSGGRVWTTAEWEQLTDPDQRAATARVTATHWQARFHVFAALREQLRTAEQALGHAAMGDEEPAQLRTIVAEEGAAQWANGIFSREDLSEQLMLVTEMRAGFQALFDEADRQRELWSQRAAG